MPLVEGLSDRDNTQQLNMTDNQCFAISASQAAAFLLLSVCVSVK